MTSNPSGASVPERPIEYVPLYHIRIDEAARIRHDLDPTGIQELADSIQQIGLLNPIIVRKDNTLMAGRRRLEALKILRHETAPVRRWEDLDEVTRLVLELDENRRRKDLSWAETALAIQRIHELKQAASMYHSQADTAKLLGASTGTVSTYLELAEWADHPRVKTRPTMEGATRTMKREKELVLVREMARRRSDRLLPGIGLDHTSVAGGTIYNGDCRKLLASLPDDSVDMIFTDPPWGVNFQAAAQWAKGYSQTYDDTWENTRALLKETIPHWYRVLRPACHVYTFFGSSDLQWWIDALIDVGFILRARPLVWFKASQAAITDQYTSFQTCYESILFGWKPAAHGKRFFEVPVSEAYSLPRPDGTYHINEKPIELIERFIAASTSHNELILDPFLGGGSTALAAFNLGRTFIGSELDAVTYRTAVERLEEAEASDDAAVEE